MYVFKSILLKWAGLIVGGLGVGMAVVGYIQYALGDLADLPVVSLRMPCEPDPSPTS